MLSTIESSLKNPAYWASFAQSAGHNYEDAKASGAAEWQAQTAALAGSLLNAGIETGSGIEPMAKSGGYGLKDWAKSTFEEGAEGFLQSTAGKAVDKAVFDHDKPWFSLEDEDAIINPYRAGREFLSDAVTGGILSGAGAAANYARRRFSGIEPSYFHSQPGVGNTDTYTPKRNRLDNAITSTCPEAASDPDFYAALDYLVDTMEPSLRRQDTSQHLLNEVSGRSYLPPDFLWFPQDQETARTSHGDTAGKEQNPGRIQTGDYSMARYFQPDGTFDLDFAKKDYQNFLSTVPERYRMYLGQSLDAISYRKINHPEVIFGYNPDQDAFWYNPEHPLFKGYDLRVVMTHELAHRIDHYFIDSQNQEGFKNAILNSRKTIVSNPDFFFKYCRENDTSGFLSDIVSAIFKNRSALPVGHPTSYWTPERQAEEIFANLFALKASTDIEKIDFIKRFFPQLFDTFEKLDFQIL